MYGCHAYIARCVSVCVCACVCAFLSLIYFFDLQFQLCVPEILLLQVIVLLLVGLCSTLITDGRLNTSQDAFRENGIAF